MANLILINHKGRQFRKVPFFRPSSQLSRASLSPTHRFTIHGSTVGTYELRKKEKRKKKRSLPKKGLREIKTRKKNELG